jgi:outer membrane protein assembly factor BamB
VPQRRRLGWLGPAIVIVGVIVAGFGVWAIVAGKPQAGEVIDTIPAGEGRSLVVRAEAGGDRNFVELHAPDEHGKDKLLWQALVPTYAGRPGAPAIAWGAGTVTVRVIRDGRAEIFALAMTNAAKLGGFKLAPGKGPVTRQTTGPITLTDHTRSYEIVAGTGWVQLVAIDLASGEALWAQDLADLPVDAAGFTDSVIWVQQRGARRAFAVTTGSESHLSPKS